MEAKARSVSVMVNSEREEKEFNTEGAENRRGHREQKEQKKNERLPADASATGPTRRLDAVAGLRFLRRSG
jgi:hypothetical protein